MLIDRDFQSEPSGTWVGGPPPGNPSIGPAAPTSPYKPFVLPDGSYVSRIDSEPKPGTFPTVETYWTRPLLQTSGKLILEFDLWVDSGIVGANAVETDTMLCTPFRHNFSLQNVEGQLYLTQKGAWIPIPGAVQKLEAGTQYHHILMYSFTPESGRFLSIAIADQTWAIPESLQVCDIADVGWSPCAMLQLQQSLSPTGTGFSVLVSKAAYTWLA